MKTKNLLLALFSVALLGGGIWYFTRKKDDVSEGGDETKEGSESKNETTQQTGETSGSSEKPKNNFDSLINNLGANVKPSKDNIVKVAFNKGNNFAQFYTNNRVVIFDANKKIVAKGTYSDGGKTIKMDSGKNISSGSVWQNLLNSLNK